LPLTLLAIAITPPQDSWPLASAAAATLILPLLPPLMLPPQLIVFSLSHYCQMLIRQMPAAVDATLLSLLMAYRYCADTPLMPLLLPILILPLYCRYMPASC